jgi:hypothetical protein
MLKLPQANAQMTEHVRFEFKKKNTAYIHVLWSRHDHIWFPGLLHVFLIIFLTAYIEMWHKHSHHCESRLPGFVVVVVIIVVSHPYLSLSFLII